MDRVTGQVRADNAFGFLDKTSRADQLFHPLLVSNRDGNTMVRAIQAELQRSRPSSFRKLASSSTPRSLPCAQRKRCSPGTSTT